jgi:hypothetical protein
MRKDGVFMIFPPETLNVGVGLVILITLAGAGTSALLTAIAGSAFPNSRLREFQPAIEQGQILVMTDAPKEQIADTEALVKTIAPEIKAGGTEPPTKLIP